MLSFTVKNHRSIKCVEVTPNVLEQRVVVVKGKEGQGKSTLLEGLQTALSGSQAVKNKDSLEPGYMTEVCLRDGDLSIWAGAKVNETGNFSIYLYSKDEDGKRFIPIVGGKKLTPSDLAKTITTDLTFRMADLFSANASTHRKLIESLFGEELDKLGVEKIKSELEDLKKKRDIARTLCEAKGAFMDTFKKEGYTENALENLKSIDTDTINKEITRLSVYLENLEQNAAKDRELALSEIVNSGQSIASSIRDVTDKLIQDYNKKKQEWLEAGQDIAREKDLYSTFKVSLEALPISAEEKQSIAEKVEKLMPVHERGEEPALPKTFDPKEMPENWDEAYKDLPEKYITKMKEYKDLKAKDLEISDEDRQKTQKQIDALKVQLQAADAVNSVYDRYQLWLDWIEKKGKYEAKKVELRKMYAKVKTGVEGMSIVPVGDDIWLEYNGESDPEFFANKGKELRQIFNYSQSQQGIIGLLLQAARLDLKSKALRLAILDSIPYTSYGLETVRKVCEEKNLRLITAQTDDRYDRENISEDEIVIENGELLFGNMV